MNCIEKDVCLIYNRYEGVVITHKDAPYQPGKRSNKVSLKIKKELQETIDCIIVGANAPTKIYNGKEIEVPGNFENLKNIEEEKYQITDDNEVSTITECTKTYERYSNGEILTPVTKNWFYGWAGSLKLGLYDGDKLIHIGDLSGITDEVKQNWKQYLNTVVEISCIEPKKRYYEIYDFFNKIIQNNIFSKEEKNDIDVDKYDDSIYLYFSKWKEICRSNCYFFRTTS